jgi:Flp pilus assembly protein TadB
VDPLFSTTIGNLLLAGGALLMVMGIFVMKRIVRIDV